jgi:hypothetical protein
MAPKMKAVRKLNELLDEWIQDVEASPLTESSKKDYIGFVAMFVRWVEGDFMPGSNLK